MSDSKLLRCQLAALIYSSAEALCLSESASSLFLSAKVCEKSLSLRGCIEATTSVARYHECHIVEDQIIAKEHHILRVLRFETDIPTPAKLLKKILSNEGCDSSVEDSALVFLKDSYFTREAAICRCDAVACACVYMADRMAGGRLRGPWWERYGVQKEEMLYVSDLISSASIFFLDNCDSVMMS